MLALESVSRTSVLRAGLKLTVDYITKPNITHSTVSGCGKITRVLPLVSGRRVKAGSVAL